MKILHPPTEDEEELKIEKGDIVIYKPLFIPRIVHSVNLETRKVAAICGYSTEDIDIDLLKIVVMPDY
jgi:hypothetical protein